MSLPIEAGKKPWLSKTIWMNVVLAIAAFIPGVHEWIVANDAIVFAFWAVVNIILRLITKDKIQIS
jgi:uncharacterized membrane protein YqaE (UPF0057 family)